MLKKVRFLSFLTILILATSACSPAADSMFPVQVTLEPTSQAQSDMIDKYIRNEIEGIDYPEEATLYGAAIVFQDDTILIDKGYGFADRGTQTPNSPSTRYRLGRISMAFASMATWMLYEQGKLDPQDKICTYIKNCPDHWNEITILDLINNTSGLPDYWLTPSYTQTLTESLSIESLVENLKKSTWDEIYADPTTIQGDSNYILLLAIIEKVTGETYETFLKENIFDPLGMKNTGVLHNWGKDDQLAVQYEDPAEDSNVDLDSAYDMYSYGGLFNILGLYSTVEDSYLFLDALIHEKVLNSEEIQALKGNKDLFAWFTNNESGIGSGWVAWSFPDVGPSYSTLWSLSYLDGPGFAYEPGTGAGCILLTNQNSSAPVGMRAIFDFLAGRESGIK